MITSCCSLVELHDFAAEIGLARAWFQHKHEHYDLTTARMIKKAIRHGARLVSPKELVRISKGRGVVTDKLT